MPATTAPRASDGDGDGVPDDAQVPRKRRFLRRPLTRASRRASPPAASSSSEKKTSSARGVRASARRTSRLMTLPEPSQIEASGASRYRRGIPESST